jgi:glycosyltransferase involved in cell wall biosynthesis
MTSRSGTPKITVIIPTRERCDVFASALHTVVVQDYDNLEILVSDNFSADDTREVVTRVADPRVRYLNTGKRLSMSGNWEFALSHATGDWVTIIGDDDGLLPDALDRASEFIREMDVLAFQSTICRYRWPGNKGRQYGRIRVPLTRGEEVRPSETWMNRVLQGRVVYAELPMLYTGGFANMAVLGDLKRRMGAFYRSCVPDVYSGFAIASLLPRYGFSRSPLAIAGISKHSIGVDHFRKREKVQTSPSQKFAAEENIPFHKDIPLMDDGGYPPSLQVTALEAYLQSAPLRNDDPPALFDQQLEVILSATGPDDRDITNWARKFAALHGLDYELARRKSRGRRLLRKLEELPVNFARRIKRRTLGSPTQTLENVYEASLAADALLRKKKLR